MPTIIAICPYCRAGGVRATSYAVGASATCPKCKSNFTLMPEDDPPDWAKCSAEASFSSVPPVEKPKLPTVAETLPTAAALSDVTEPSPVLPAKLKPKPAPATAPSFDLPAPADMGLVFALLAFILVGPAVLASQLPYGRIIALVLAAGGLVGGLLCLGAEGKARVAGLGAAALHFLGIVVLLFLPSWLGHYPSSSDGKPEELKGPHAVDLNSGAPAPISPADWLNAGTVSWQSGNVRVTVRAAVGPLELSGPKGAKRTTKEPYLRLAVRVRNTGFENELPLSGWAAGQGADGVRVLDANDRPLKIAAFESAWAPERGKPTTGTLPGHTSEVVLVFAPPPAKSEFVRVQLSGAAVGAPDEIRFRAGFPARGSFP